MKFKELKKSLSLSVEPFYLVCGEDAFFTERSLKLICDACLKEPDFNLTSFVGAEVKGNFGMLTSALTSYPFMSDKRVVVVKEYYPLAADVAELKKYAADPLDTTVFVIVNSSPTENVAKIPGVTTVDCSKGDFSLVASWIVNEAKKAGVVVTQGAVNLIVDYCQYDMTRINGETEKLIAYTADKKVIEEQDVLTLCTKETDYKIYEVVDLIAKRDREAAYSVLTETLGSTGDGQKIFISLYNHFRRLFYASVSTLPNGDIAKALGVKEFAVKKAKEQAASFSPKRLKGIIDNLAGYDASFKSGFVSQQDAVWNGILNVLLG